MIAKLMKVINVLINPVCIIIYIILGALLYSSYSQKQDQVNHVVLYQESSGKLYSATIGNPVFKNYLINFNIFDRGEVFDTKSYDLMYFYHIGNIRSEIPEQNQIEITSAKLIPTRKYVDFNKLPEALKKKVDQLDVYDIEINGLETYGIKSLKMIAGVSSDVYLNEYQQKWNMLQDSKDKKKE